MCCILWLDVSNLKEKDISILKEKVNSMERELSGIKAHLNIKIEIKKVRAKSISTTDTELSIEKEREDSPIWWEAFSDQYKRK